MFWHKRCSIIWNSLRKNLGVNTTRNNKCSSDVHYNYSRCQLLTTYHDLGTLSYLIYYAQQAYEIGNIVPVL